MKTRIIEFIKRETVLTAAGLLALFSCLFVKPEAEDYMGYIMGNLNTLIVLFCLMTVVAGLGSLGVFRYVGEGLLKKLKSERGIAFLLVFLCFFGSMFITNDVALITFVPFAIMVLNMAGMAKKLCYTVVMMTIAANLGSMLTPVGNPQNLYLYASSGMTMAEFIRLMLPFTLVSALLLAGCLWCGFQNVPVQVQIKEKTEKPDMPQVIYYVLLFLICLQTVSGFLPSQGLLLIILGAVIVRDRSLFFKVDYSLLLTFLFFFVFIGNMSQYQPCCHMVEGLVKDHEVAAAVAMSQIISNVPAALLLSGFTSQWEALIIGTNLGGLGTLIASMASLISYKQIAAEFPKEKGRYFGMFTVWNVVFLAVLLIVAGIMG